MTGRIRFRACMTALGLMALHSTLALAATSTLFMSNTAASGVTPAGLTLSAAASSATGWNPTTTLNTTAKYWYSPAQTQSYAAGTWNVVLWTNGPGSSTHRVELLKADTNGGSATVLGSATLDISTTGGGNHASTFAIALGAQSFANQRIALRVTKTAGADAIVAFNGNDFPSRVITADTSAITPLAITTQPASQSRSIGSTATFCVAATGGTGAVTYQWYKNSAAIAGATGACYTTPTLASADNNASYTCRVSDGTTTLTSSAAVLTVSAGGVTVPAQVEAEAYTSMVGVQAEACAEGGQNVGWIDAGDSMTYLITVPATAAYTIQYRVASPYATGVLASSFNGSSLGTVAIPNTGGWQAWATVSQTVTLNAGSNNFVITVPVGGWNLNWIAFTTSTQPVVTITTQPASRAVSAGQTATFTVTATTTSGTLAYQWYKNNAVISGATAASYTTPATTAADNGAVFHVRVSAGTTSVNSNGATLTVGSGVAVPARIEAENYTAMTGVQTETCAEGGVNVGWIDAGDSMSYAITVPSTGTYTIQYRVASPNATGVLAASFNGTALGNASIPTTGSWQTWTTISQTVTLNAASGNLVLTVPTGGWNLNWIDIASGNAAITVTVNPASASLSTNGTQQFNAVVTGTANTAVTWTATGGTITASGFYTAPATSGTYTVKATSQASGSASGSATVIVSSGDVEARINSLVSQMSLSEKILQIHGSDAFNTPDNTRLGIPGFHMADGSYGRIGGTLWPCPIATGCTWDPDLVRRYGVAEGKEFRSTGANVALSPMLNLLRDPRWGRSSEAYGEDSFLIAQLGTAQIQGIQSVQAIAEAKHYACYNSISGMVNISERALRENYLFQFEKAIKVGGAKVIMAAYNGVNGYACTANKHLLTDILKSEWGFQGFVNSDWGSIYNCVDAANAGTDLAMPGFGGFETLEADVAAGRVPMSRLDDMVRRVLRVKFWAGMMDAGYTPTKYAGQINSADSRSVSLEMARKSIVLAKNTNGLLPISKTRTMRVAILADPAPAGFGTNTGLPVTWATSYNDGYRGSTYIGCVEIPKTFTQGIQSKLAGTGITLVSDAASADLILYFTGIPGAGSNGIEGEGFDRTFLSIPVTAQMTSTMNQYAAKTVVVITGGSNAVKGPWSAAAGIVIALFPGIDQGQALADVLFGDVNPSGKLSATWPNAESDLPAFDLPTQPYEEAWEGPGWHYFEARNIQPFLEFGRGLSYTTFTYSGLSSSVVGAEVVVTVSVTNSGSRAGDEVVQAYVGKSSSSVQRRVKDLRGFQRVSLNPGETKQIQIRIQRDDLRYWDTTGSTWILEPGTYNLSIGSSSKDIRLTGSFNL